MHGIAPPPNRNKPNVRGQRAERRRPPSQQETTLLKRLDNPWRAQNNARDLRKSAPYPRQAFASRNFFSEDES
jgi:hypothetical protein